jgi:hypothetical protein
MTIEPVTRVLDAAEVSYALIGAHATAVRGYPRFTVDVGSIALGRSPGPLRALIARNRNARRRTADRTLASLENPREPRKPRERYRPPTPVAAIVAEVKLGA